MRTVETTRLLIVGNPSQEHVGHHFLAAARQMGLEAALIDLREAWGRSKWVNRFHWHLRGKRPPNLRGFSRKVIETCRAFAPGILLTTGVSPLSADALEEIGRLGIRRVNFLTDDPWNPRNGADFFWEALKSYDAVYSPRKSNLGDLTNHGCRKVQYLPFAYNPEIHFFEAPACAAEQEQYACDAALVGGGDEDRLPLVRALLREGFRVKLYGAYWERYPGLRSSHQGCVFGRELRLAVSAPTANLCMGRKANRDGHAMRSLELPAMGGCMIVEDTEEHRCLFGPEGEAVLYYADTGAMLRQVTRLKADPALAIRLGQAVRGLITGGKHTYADRLRSMLAVASSGV